MRLNEFMHYRILDTVTLGSQGDRDFVPVYDSDCRDDRLMPIQRIAQPHVDNFWELGQPGLRYMLCYVECGPGWSPSLPLRSSLCIHWFRWRLKGRSRRCRRLISSKATRHLLPTDQPVLQSPVQSTMIGTQETNGPNVVVCQLIPALRKV